MFSEDFLYNEQKLLISAWKIILNNFHLAKEFKSLPKESEEITIDDYKLFIFIITGLFIGYSTNRFFNDDYKDYENSYINRDKKCLFKSDSSCNLKKYSFVQKEKHLDLGNEIINLENNNLVNNDKNIINNSPPSSKRYNIYSIKKNFNNLSIFWKIFYKIEKNLIIIFEIY